MTRPIVIFVDDDITYRDLMASYLNDKFDIRAYSSVEELLGNRDLLDEAEALILDRQLPGESGDHFLIYTLPQINPCLAVVMLTGDPEFGMHELANAKPYKFCSKKDGFDQLEASIDAAITATNAMEARRAAAQ